MTATTRRRMDERIAVVTAAGSGMGRAIARSLAGDGAFVYVTDLDGNAATETADLIEAEGGQARGFAMDVCDSNATEALLKTVTQDHGKLHVLYNHAGIPGPGTLELTDAEFDAVIDVNLKSAYRITIQALPLLRTAAPHASVLFTSSAASLSASRTSPVYSASKGAINALVRSLAARLGPEGIRCNAICPGFIDSAMFPAFVSREDNLSREEARARIAKRVEESIPLGRLGQPEDIGPLAAFLASDDASYITGIALPVDGGYLA